MTKASTDIGALANHIGVPAASGGAGSRRGQVFCGDIDIRIRRDGTWAYHGSPIGRKELVRLFASVLRRDDAGDYWLVTPIERGRIQVEDAPFVAVELAVAGSGRQQALTFRTNVDEHVVAGPDRPIRVGYDTAARAPRPYVLVRPGLEALILRPVYYQLVELGVEEARGNDQILGVWSRGAFFPLGSLGEAA